jgi:hypothetical protein
MVPVHKKVFQAMWTYRISISTNDGRWAQKVFSENGGVMPATLEDYRDV